MLVHGYIAVLINVCNYQLRNFGGQLAHGLALAVNVVSARARCTVIIHAERKALIAAQLLALIFYRNHPVPNASAYIERGFYARKIIVIEMLLYRRKEAFAHFQLAVGIY